MLKLLLEIEKVMTSVKPYKYFSQIYSHLMKSIDYSFWADYIKEIHTTIGQPSDIALEVGAGNGKLAKYLQNQFSKLYLTDISKEMLRQNKANVDCVCCDMTALPFKDSFNFIFSTFDSINYLSNEDQIKLFFNRIKNNLTDNGYFLFDVSLESNSLKHVENLNRSGEYKGITYIQESYYDKKNKLHINILEIKLPNNKWYFERHEQKIYDFYYYFDVIESEGLFVAECFDAFTFENASQDSERIQFIVKKEN